MAVIGSISAVAINIVLSALLLPSLGARGLLLANGIGGLANLAFLTVLLWRLIGGLEWKPFLSSFVRVCLASLVMALALYWIRSLGFVPTVDLWSRLWYLMGLLGIGLAVYVGAARALGVQELTLVVEKLKQKVKRRPVEIADGADTPVA
jgi:putative peptidoglycan lipid II flippase